ESHRAILGNVLFLCDLDRVELQASGPPTCSYVGRFWRNIPKPALLCIIVFAMADYTKIAASSPVLYIKLGDGGKWEQDCIEKGIIRFGYTQTSEKALRGDWAGVRDYWSSQRKSQGAATRDLDQIKHFFESDESTIWITFHDRFLWWCRAKSEPNPNNS
ncbi:MAG TPA: hypothetical protein VKA94_02340, partial [Hyphomicrobiales bacterium]|nr:hypothetical protein [Hyphomicrobiales bacterium]